MYETFFEMQKTPFSKDIPSSELYESPVMSDALGRLAYTADRQLFAVVTADAGCGKSTLIRRFADSLPKEEYLLLYLSDSKLTPRWFYKGMLDQLGIESKFYRGDAKRQLQKEVEIIRGVQKKKVVCILDEAHLLEKETIEEFRFLLNYHYDSMSPLALVLVGQTELWDKLRLQRYAAVRQRIDIICVLPHLDRAETGRYIQSHLVLFGKLKASPFVTLFQTIMRRFFLCSHFNSNVLRRLFSGTIWFRQINLCEKAGVIFRPLFPHSVFMFFYCR